MAELFGIYKGIVKDVIDPQEANRIRVYIPGICDPISNWAEPIGMFGSAANFGSFGVPPEGSEVYIQFEAGDIDFPIYQPTGKGKLEFPEEYRGSLNKWGFMFLDTMIMFEQTENSGKIKLYTNDRENFITIDGVTNKIELKSLSGINIETTGELNLNASTVKIQNRIVQNNGREI